MNRVCEDEARLLGKREFELDVVVVQFGLNKADRRLHNLTDIRALPPDLTFAREIADPDKNFIGALGLAHDLVQAMLQIFKPRLASAHFAQTCLRVSHDSAKGLIELVRQAGNHSAKRAETRDVRKFRLPFAVMLFRIDQSRDVLAGRDKMSGCSVVVLQRAYGHLLVIEPTTFGMTAEQESKIRAFADGIPEI